MEMQNLTFSLENYLKKTNKFDDYMICLVGY